MMTLREATDLPGPTLADDDDEWEAQTTKALLAKKLGLDVISGSSANGINRLLARMCLGPKEIGR